MNKKAASIILMLFEVIVVIVVVGIALTVATRLGKPETINKITAAEDLAMMVNTLVALPGDALVEYPRNMSLYSLVLTSQKVTIYEGDQTKDRDPVSRPFILPQGYTATKFVKQKARVCLQKEGKTIVIVECPKP